MSVFDDLRKLFQDLVAPELRSISVQVEGIEKRIDRLEKHLDDRFVDLDKRLAANQAQIVLSIQQLSDYYGLAQRVSAIERRADPEVTRTDH